MAPIIKLSLKLKYGYSLGLKGRQMQHWAILKGHQKFYWTGPSLLCSGEVEIMSEVISRVISLFRSRWTLVRLGLARKEFGAMWPIALSWRKTSWRLGKMDRTSIAAILLLPAARTWRTREVLK